VSPIGDGFAAVVAILAACALPTQVWRWIGVAVGQRIDADSEVLHWVRAVATAIIAAFVAKVLVFPTASLAETSIWLRFAATAFAVLVYIVTGRTVVAGVIAGVVALLAGQLIFT
jgi:branched-subunit amino acid transport protein